MNIGLVNTLTSNIKSVFNALDKLGYNGQYEEIFEYTKKNYTHLIFPGNGNYQANIKTLQDKKIDLFLSENFKKNTLYLGICVGMQILSSQGEEGSVTEGTNIIEGNVEKINTLKYRLPHIGWNNIDIKQNDNLLINITKEDTFYFLHSYAFRAKRSKNVLATTSYGSKFSSIVKNKNFYGVQFHPEKSQNSGLKLIQNFLNMK